MLKTIKPSEHEALFDQFEMDMNILFDGLINGVYTRSVDSIGNPVYIDQKGKQAYTINSVFLGYVAGKGYMIIC